MSNNKSLGSSPIGYQSSRKSLGFIPDLGVSKSARASGNDNNIPSYPKPSKKQIVSYSLEKSLVARVKAIADENGMYYSSLVSKALKSWLTKNT